MIDACVTEISSNDDAAINRCDVNYVTCIFPVDDNCLMNVSTSIKNSVVKEFQCFFFLSASD